MIALRVTGCQRGIGKEQIMLKLVAFCLHCNKSDRAHTADVQFGQNCTKRTLHQALQPQERQLGLKVWGKAT